VAVPSRAAGLGATGRAKKATTVISLKMFRRRVPPACTAPAPVPAPAVAWESALLPAAVLRNRQLERLEEAIAHGLVCKAARPLYRALLQGPLTVLEMLVTCEPHRSLLQRVGPGDQPAITAGYLQLQGQQLWEIFEAFEHDPRLSERIGTDFVGFVMDFERLCGVDAAVLMNAFRQASEYWRGPARSADPAVVVDLQSFDVLQTITSGRYTTEHWRSAGPALEVVQRGILELRLRLLRQAKEAIGLSGRVL
jgi:hypothetical protein